MLNSVTVAATSDIFARIFNDQSAANLDFPTVGEVLACILTSLVLGLLIGFVEEIGTDANRLTRSGTIRPAADFDDLDSVLVVTTLKISGETP